MHEENNPQTIDPDTEQSSFSPNHRMWRWQAASTLLFFEKAQRLWQAANPSVDPPATNAKEGSPEPQWTSGASPTPRKSAEVLQRKYEALLESAPDAVFVADSETGRIVEANQAAASLLNSSIDAIVGRHQSELHPPKEREKYRTLFEHHQGAAADGPASRKTLPDGSQVYAWSDDGRRIPVEISASFVDVPGNELFVGIFRDISDQKQEERRLKEAKASAEEASALKSAMLANVSHEIRTPITSIIGFSKVLTRMLDGESSEHAERIYQAGQHLMKTVQSILELSKLESGVERMPRTTVRLGRVAEWTAELLEPQASEKNVSVQVDQPDQPVEAFGNREALNRIAENLVENAIKFTPDGGSVQLRVREEEDAVLEVEDTGIGMGPETVDGLFDPFRQGSKGTDRDYGGMGLGLSIVKELVQRLDGRIDVETEKGVGSTFVVRLPPHADSTARS